MNREQLEARKADFQNRRAKTLNELEAARAQVNLLQATFNTFDGVVQDCDHWLSFVAPAPAPQDPPAVGSTARTATAPAALVDVLKERKKNREGSGATAAA